ncbi:MAG: hypothetical protein ACM3U1_03735 [Chloroflexota bacterium]
MKRLLLIALLALVAVEFSFSQELYPSSLGVYLGGKDGISTTVAPAGRGNGQAFSDLPDFGFSYYHPLGEVNNLGFKFDLGFERNVFTVVRKTDDKKFYHRFDYISINPNFFFQGAFLGLAYNIPIHADWEGHEIKSGALASGFEVTGGIEFNLLEDKTGRLNILLKGNYVLYGVYDDFSKNDPLGAVIPSATNENHNPRPFGGMLGVSYYFNLKEPKSIEYEL